MKELSKVTPIIIGVAAQEEYDDPYTFHTLAIVKDGALAKKIVDSLNSIIFDAKEDICQCLRDLPDETLAEMKAKVIELSGSDTLASLLLGNGDMDLEAEEPFSCGSYIMF